MLLTACSSDSVAPTAASGTTTTDVGSLARQVTVYKVARDVPQGMSGREAIDQGYVIAASIAAEFDPVTSVKDIEQIRDNYALYHFAVGQVVVIGMFVPLTELCDPTFGPCPNS